MRLGNVGKVYTQNLALLGGVCSYMKGFFKDKIVLYNDGIVNLPQYKQCSRRKSHLAVFIAYIKQPGKCCRMSLIQIKNIARNIPFPVQARCFSSHQYSHYSHHTARVNWKRNNTSHILNQYLAHFTELFSRLGLHMVYSLKRERGSTEKNGG